MPTLRTHQLDVLDRARNRLRAGLKRGIIQGQTDSGKTYVLAELARIAQEKGSRRLLLTHRRKPWSWMKFSMWYLGRGNCDNCEQSPAPTLLATTAIPDLQSPKPNGVQQHEAASTE